MQKDIHQQTSTDSTNLHPIADSQERHLPLLNNVPHSLRHMRSTLLVHTVRSTTQNHSRQLMLTQLFWGYEA